MVLHPFRFKQGSSLKSLGFNVRVQGFKSALNPKPIWCESHPEAPAGPIKSDELRWFRYPK